MKYVIVSVSEAISGLPQSFIPRNNKYSSAGFTLLEILIALAILIIGVASVVNMFPVGLHASKRAADFSSAAILAQEKMAELMYLGYNNWSSVDDDLTGIPSDTADPPSDDGKNSFPAPDDRYKWFIDVAGDDYSTANLAKVTLWIYWNDRGVERDAEFITYIANR